jgi:L-lactate utilization protein LutB
MEPSPAQKRHTLAQALRNPAGTTASSMEEVEIRLRSLRASAIEDMEISLEQLKSVGKKQESRQWFYAASAADAAGVIRRICPDTKAVAINKSAVVSGEVAPILARAGIQVLRPYYDDLSETEVRFAESWQLPEIPFAMRYQAFECREDLPARRQICIHEKGARDLVAVIGVNALSAEDGGAVLLQHRQNISRMLTECREIFLIAGIDKVVPTMDAAVFQAKCMAWFGTDSLALGLGKNAGPHTGLDSYPFTIRPEELSGRIKIIVLDNSRRKIMGSDYRKLLQCIGCRACIKQCPASRFFGEETLLSPRELLYLNLLAIGKPLAYCLQCKSCRTACPVDIDLPGMILNLRLSRNKRLFPALSDLMLSNAEEVERMGSLFAPIANVLLKNRLIKQLSEFAGGIESRRALPSFATKTFERIYRESKSGSGQ